MSALFLWRCLFRVQAMMILNGAFVSLVLLLSSLLPPSAHAHRSSRVAACQTTSVKPEISLTLSPLELTGQHGQPSVFAVFTAWDLLTADNICVLFCPASHSAL